MAAQLPAWYLDYNNRAADGPGGEPSPSDGNNANGGKSDNDGPDADPVEPD